MRMPDLPGGSEDADDHELDEDDAWAEARALVETIEPDELTDPQVGSERLLYRLFHERGVRVYESQAVLDKCSCSREKISVVLEQLDNEQVAESLEDGVIAVTCEFCSTTYRFSAEEVLEGRDSHLSS
jgi:molecular chaperone Hsp33